MTVVLAILFGFVAFCIVALVLLQESKGGGISAMGVPGMDSIMGARNPLRKLTVIFALLFLVLVIVLGVTINMAKEEAFPEGVPEAPEAPEEPQAPAPATQAPPAEMPPSVPLEGAGPLLPASPETETPLAPPAATEEPE